MKLKLNIGTLAHNGTHSLTAGDIITACQNANLKLLQTSCKQSNTEVTLCALAEYRGEDELHAVIYNLACVLDQDCVAWIDESGTGHLTGPGAEKWGSFNVEFFIEPPASFNACTFCMAWESGDLSDAETAAGFQHLIDSRTVWTLQGCYVRTAQRLLNAGLCHRVEA